MVMPGRSFTATTQYRYGFNGKENDNEVKGTGNQQDYGMRIYDTRIGRFLSVDPIANNFPWNSPYSYAENDPINSVDLDGAEKASPSTVDIARQLLNIVGNNITATKTKLSTTTDESIKQNLQVSLELDKRTYAAIMVFIYRNNPTTTERIFDILDKAEPYVKEGLDITPAGDIKVVFTGRNFQGEEKNRYGAVGWLAFDVFGGEILKGLGNATRSLRLLKGPGADALEGVVKRVNNISTALDDVHLKAAVGDIFGNPVIINGKVYDHLTEVKNAINGLTKEIKKLNKIISNGKNGEEVIKAAEDLRNTLSKQKNEINAIIDRATKSAANK
jgi:RHS repeat-associated protein